MGPTGPDLSQSLRAPAGTLHCCAGICRPTAVLLRTGAGAQSSVHPTAANEASYTQQVPNKLPKILTKIPCTLTFQASTERKQFGEGNEEGKGAGLTSQGADPTVDLSLGTEESQFQKRHIRKNKVGCSLCDVLRHHADIQAYFCNSVTIYTFSLVVY